MEREATVPSECLFVPVVLLDFLLDLAGDLGVVAELLLHSDVLEGHAGIQGGDLGIELLEALDRELGLFLALLFLQMQSQRNT